jgi:hypothetical protein
MTPASSVDVDLEEVALIEVGVEGVRVSLRIKKVGWPGC